MQQDLGLLVLRLGGGLFMLIGHGWPKLMKFSQLSTAFPDPLGVGPAVSLGLAIFAEVLCALLLSLGILGRISAIPLFITMIVAAFGVHGQDPWSKKEFALIYAVIYLALAISGPGKLSVDNMVRK